MRSVRAILHWFELVIASYLKLSVGEERMTEQQRENLTNAIRAIHNLLDNEQSLHPIAKDIKGEHLLADLEVALEEIDPLLAEAFEATLRMAYASQ